MVNALLAIGFVTLATLHYDVHIQLNSLKSSVADLTESNQVSASPGSMGGRYMLGIPRQFSYVCSSANSSRIFSQCTQQN